MPDYEWNQQTRRFTSRGKPVPPERVREWVKEAQEKSRERLKGFAEDYRTGRINRSQMFVSLNEEITRAHSAVAMIASGGRNAMDARKWGAVGKRVSEQRSFSRKFHAEMLEVDAKDFPAWRAESYASVYTHTYDNLFLVREEGRKVERVLGSSEEHCSTCPGKAGVYEAEKAPPLGSDECGPGCNCYFREVEEVAA